MRRLIFIGDLQGCAGAFERLLERLRFDPAGDRLCLAGDLVNRGGESLAALKTVADLGEPHFTVLGNHDFHLLAYAHYHPDVRKPNREFEAVLAHLDGERLLDWLRRQPVLWTEPDRRLALVHAGLDPRWDGATAAACARELEEVLRGPHLGDFLERMYGDKPRRWQPDLPRWQRLRAITNVFARIRFCDESGRLELRGSGDLADPPSGCRPWFELMHPDWDDWTVVFGHWSLLGFHRIGNAVCLDSGCVWGGELTAMVVEGDERRFVQVDCE